MIVTNKFHHVPIGSSERRHICFGKIAEDSEGDSGRELEEGKHG